MTVTARGADGAEVEAVLEAGLEGSGLGSGSGTGDGAAGVGGAEGPALRIAFNCTRLRDGLRLLPQGAGGDRRIHASLKLLRPLGAAHRSRPGLPWPPGPAGPTPGLRWDYFPMLLRLG